MSSDDNQRQANMTPTTRHFDICLFSPPLLFISVLQLILFHIILVEFYKIVCFKMVEQSCSTVVCQRSHICWVHGVDTMFMFC